MTGHGGLGQMVAEDLVARLWRHSDQLDVECERKESGIMSEYKPEQEDEFRQHFLI